MGKIDVYQIVTDKMIDALEKGTVPWRRPWRIQKHLNLANKYEYKGINQLLCEMYMMDNEYTYPYWMTYKGAKKLGGSVRKGEKGHIVVLWKPMYKTDEVSGEEVLSHFMLRYYNVFNADQCDDIALPEVESIEIDPNEEAENIIKGMPDPPRVTSGGNAAFYEPPKDRVNIPKVTDFVDMDAYYATTFHELVHSTGHETRLNRDEVTKTTMFGTSDYSREELVAELGSAMLCAQTGIDPSTQDRSASYIASWLKKLNDDKKFILSASSRAQKAVEYIINEPKEKVKDGD